MIKMYEKEISKIYTNIREEEKKNYNLRINEISNRFPEIIQIDKTIQKLSLNLSLSILRGKSESEILSIKEEIQMLRDKRNKMLTDRNLPINYLSLWYKCPKCEDTGVYNHKKCSCYKEKLISLYYKNSDIKELLKSNNFDNFDFSLFSNKKSIDNKYSDKANMENIVNYITETYLPNFNNSDTNLLFYGNSGTGKTFMSCCIAKALLDVGFLVVYKTSDELIRALKDIKFNNNYELEDLLVNCDLLIIDDLGAEQITDFGTTELYNLLNKKILKNKKMLISTNLNLVGLVKMYTERISSRLTGNFKMLKFHSEDDVRVKVNLRK